MSAYGTKVVAVVDTQSTFGVTLKSLRDDVQTLNAAAGVLGTRLNPGTFNLPTLPPLTPVDGDIYFDKVALKLKIYVNDGNSTQWVQL